MESAYRACLVHELRSANLHTLQEVHIPVLYKGAQMDCGYRADLIVEDRVLVELKSVDRLLPIHDAQLLTYLKLSKLRTGLLLNFNVSSLRKGIRRLVR
jgi:GxxExxY protein